MTLEEAAAEVEQAAESLNGPDPSQASLRMVAKVARVFPKMLEALKEDEGELPTCTRPGCRCATCLTRDALRAAREAVKP